MSQESDFPLLHLAMKRATERLVPLQASLELTYRCNLACQHCYVEPASRGQFVGELTTEEWIDVLEQLQAAGTLSLMLTGGEILVRSDFFQIAIEARRKGFLLWLSTNGTMIDRRAAIELCRLKPQAVAISLHGASAEGHEAVTGRPGSFQAAIDGIRFLQEQGLPVLVQASLMDANAREGERLTALGESLGVPLRIGYELVPTKGCALSPQQHEAAEGDLGSHLSCAQILQGFPSSAPGICKAGRAMVSISPRGDVYPCLLMPLRIGNLREKSFTELWRTAPCSDLTYLRSLCSHDLAACQDCEIARFCNRCSGVALAETGSLTGRPPSACRYAALRARLYKREREVVPR